MDEMEDCIDRVDCSKCSNKRCIFAGSEIEKKMCYDYKPISDKRIKSTVRSGEHKAV